MIPVRDSSPTATSLAGFTKGLFCQATSFLVCESKSFRLRPESVWCCVPASVGTDRDIKKTRPIKQNSLLLPTISLSLKLGVDAAEILVGHIDGDITGYEDDWQVF